jgi:hypothetical protein
MLLYPNTTRRLDCWIDKWACGFIYTEYKTKIILLKINCKPKKHAKRRYKTEIVDL